MLPIKNLTESPPPLPAHQPTGMCKWLEALLVVCNVRVWGLTARTKPPPRKSKLQRKLSSANLGQALICWQAKRNWPDFSFFFFFIFWDEWNCSAHYYRYFTLIVEEVTKDLLILDPWIYLDSFSSMGKKGGKKSKLLPGDGSFRLLSMPFTNQVAKPWFGWWTGFPPVPLPRETQICLQNITAK